MTTEELIQAASELGYQISPLPKVIDHDLRPGDYVEEIPEPWMEKIAKQAVGAEQADSMFNFKPIRGTVVAVASRADVFILRDDGRLVLQMAHGLMGEPKVRKIQKP